MPSRSGNRAAHGDNIIREPFTAVRGHCGLPISPRDIQEIRPAEFMPSFSQGTGGPHAGQKHLHRLFIIADVLPGALFGELPEFLLASGGQQKGRHRRACLSNGDECPQAGGVSPSSISVYRWDNMHDNELVWDAEPKNPITAGNISGVVTYGVPPKDWINKLTPPALICGKAYLVNPGAHYFALKCDGTVVVFDDPHLEEFFREKTPAEPEKIKSKGPETRRTTH